MSIPTDYLEIADLLGGEHPALPMVLLAAEGDETSMGLVYDVLVEEGILGEQMKTPYEVGRKYLFMTLTLYYIGEVVEAGFGFVRLKNASWVHWTGNLIVLAKYKQFRHPEFNNQRPKTMFVGEVILHTQSLVDSIPGDPDGVDWEIPMESIQE